MSDDSQSTYAGVGTAYLAVDREDEDDPYVIHGVALGVDDVTVGQSGVKKLWPAEELEKAAETLAGQDLVRDHINTTQGKVGEVTLAEYIEGVGIIYEAEIAPHYDELAKDLQAGLMDVSVRAFHAPEDELEVDEDTGALIVEDIYFDNLSIVNQGASPSNTAEVGSIDMSDIDFASAEASVFVDEQFATATLERSAPVDQETVENAQHEGADHEDDCDCDECADCGCDDSCDVDLDEEESSENDTPDNESAEEAEVEEVDEDDVDEEDLEEDTEADEEDLDEPVEESQDAESEIKQLVEYELDEPFWEATTEVGFDDPSLGDWDLDSWEDLTETQQEVVSEHYVLSTSGFPPEDFNDLELPVVTPDGELSREALAEAYDSADTYDDITDELRELIDEVARDEFGVDAEALSAEDAESVPVATSTATSGTYRTATLSHPTQYMIEYETAEEEELESLDDPVVVERSDLEDLESKADQAETVESELEQLSEKLDGESEATKIVDQLSDEDLEMIESDEDAVVVEASMTEMFAEVTAIYAEELAKHWPGTDTEELAERFSPTELREKVDEHEEAELSASIEESEPEPEAGSVEEEELSGEDEAEAKEEELREKFAEQLEANGWPSQAEKVRNGELPVSAD